MFHIAGWRCRHSRVWANGASNEMRLEVLKKNSAVVDNLCDTALHGDQGGFMLDGWHLCRITVAICSITRPNSRRDYDCWYLAIPKCIRGCDDAVLSEATNNNYVVNIQLLSN